jgi:hypothetical protein
MQKLEAKPVKPKKVVREAKSINLLAQNEISSCAAFYWLIRNERFACYGSHGNRNICYVQKRITFLKYFKLANYFSIHFILRHE